MPGAPTAAYACSCLNVRIAPVPTTASAPPSSGDFTPVHVGDEGIFINHLQLTVRVRSRAEAMTRNRRARYTSVTCLICQVLVYRVHQVIPLDADSRDGPLLPTEDWVEQDLLKSPSGWIEVHKQCLTGDAISRAEGSSEYSPLFSVTVPVQLDPPASPQPPAHDGPKKAFLEHLTPLFLPPPFTPGNPAFAHLSSIATAQSNAWRASVEDEIAALIRAKTEQLLHSEAVLRRQVETIYSRFRDGMQAVEQADAAALASPRSPRSSISGASGTGTPSSPTSGAADYGFVPLPVAPVRHELPTSMSALSASLAVSGMHHPRAQQPQPEPTSPVSTLFDSVAGTSPTLTANSVTHPPGREFDGEANLLDIPRRMDDTINTAASFRFFQIEEEMQRKQEAVEVRRREPSVLQQPVAESSAAAASRAGPSTVNGSGNRADDTSTNGQQPAENGKGKGKGKKKMVTFQSQPAVVTIKREVKAEKEEEDRLTRNDGDEMVFDFETDNKGTESTEGTVMTLVEGPPQPRPSQPRRTSGGRKLPKDSAGLPQSFAALRPASLPVFSHMRPRRSPLRPLNDLPDASQHQRQDEERTADDDGLDGEDYDSRDYEILKLVAAHNPSHRGAWKKGSAEWKAFVNNRNGRYSSSSLDDDDDEMEPPVPAHINNAGIASSMPIAIRTLGRPPVHLSLASYRPEEALPPNQNQNRQAPSQPPAPGSLRSSMYAERDIHRAIDPGALDFAVDNGTILEEDEAEADDDDRLGRGRDRALRILQARNELPDSSMFYSLAS
ncbi:hypothetical protein C8F01DRAFT_1018302 [Mycena amicta]|nr:hypothetical protein C8F01DRAFT_1018302 [Mycena amicta]